MSNKACPICGAGNLHAQRELIAVEHQGHKGEIESQFSLCDVCEVDQTNSADARFNKRAMIAFKKKTQGLLTGEEVLNLRKRLKLNQEEAAKVFGGGPVAFSKYENNDIIQSESMDKLLRLVDKIPAARDELIDSVGITRTKDASWENVEVVNFTRTRKTKVELTIKTNELDKTYSYGP